LKRCVIVCVAVCLLASTGTSIAQQPTAAPPSAAPMRLEPRPCALMALRFIRPSMVPRLTRDLGLSDEQAAKATDVLTKADEAMKPLVEEQRRATAEFARALAKPDSSHAALVSAFEKAMKAETAMASEMIKTLFALRDLLTDQQKQQFNKLIETQTGPWTREITAPATGSQPAPAPAAPSPGTAPQEPTK